MPPLSERGVIMRQVQIKQLYDEYCEWMESIDEARAQMAEAFKALNDVSDEDWNILMDYSFQQIGE